MRKFYTVGIVLLMNIALSTLATTAHATLTTFAQFGQINSNQPFVFTNASASSTFSLASTPINFTYLITNGYGSTIGSSINAHMTITSTVAAVTSSSGTSPNRNFDQSLTGITIQFIADTPVNGQTNLLTILAGAGATSSGGLLSGREGRTTGNLDGSQSPGGGDSIIMSSDFLDFSNTTQRDYSVSLNAITPAMGLNANNYLNTFAANATGTFASDPVPITIPEPNSIVLLVLSGAGVGIKRRKKLL
jgi:hypothetical protein